MAWDTKKKETIITIISVLLLIGYLAVNWEEIFDAEYTFLLTTIGIFMWLVLIVLFVIHSIVEEVRKDMTYTIEDNIVEIKLLKDLTEKQIEEMQLLHTTIGAIMRSKVKPKAPSPKKSVKKKKK